jgi:hypothetical protein
LNEEGGDGCWAADWSKTANFMSEPSKTANPSLCLHPMILQQQQASFYSEGLVPIPNSSSFCLPTPQCSGGDDDRGGGGGNVTVVEQHNNTNNGHSNRHVNEDEQPVNFNSYAVMQHGGGIYWSGPQLSCPIDVPRHPRRMKVHINGVPYRIYGNKMWLHLQFGPGVYIYEDSAGQVLPFHEDGSVELKNRRKYTLFRPSTFTIGDTAMRGGAGTLCGVPAGSSQTTMQPTKSSTRMEKMERPQKKRRYTSLAAEMVIVDSVSNDLSIATQLQPTAGRQQNSCVARNNATSMNDT